MRYSRVTNEQIDGTTAISVIGNRLTLGYEILKRNNKSRECDSENKVEQIQVVRARQENEIGKRDRTSVFHDKVFMITE